MENYDDGALEMLRLELGLGKLYFIKEYPGRLLFGARSSGGMPFDTGDLKNRLAQLLGKPMSEIQIRTTGYDEVDDLLDEMRPYVQSDGGDIAIVGADETTGKITLSLQGACSGCPSSVVTLKIGIERLLKQYLPWVKEVEPDQPPVEPDFGFDLGGNQPETQKGNRANEGTPGSD